jgi:N-acetylmuramoyl-L-alanine amidase
MLDGAAASLKIPTCTNGRDVDYAALTSFLSPACSSVGSRLSEMKCRALVYCLLYCLLIASSAGSDLPPRVALDIGHSIKHPGAYSARGVGEYYFNRAIAAALLQSLKKFGEVDAFIINPHGASISLAEPHSTGRQQARNFVSLHPS